MEYMEYIDADEDYYAKGYRIKVDVLAAQPCGECSLWSRYLDNLTSRHPYALESSIDLANTILIASGGRNAYGNYVLFKTEEDYLVFKLKWLL